MTNLTDLPMIAMRGLLVFPQMTLSFDIERDASIRAADEAASGDHLIFLSMQKNVEDEAPGPDGVYLVGTVCRVRQLLRQMKGYSRMIVEGLYRADRTSTIKRSQDNPILKELYEGVLKGKVHELLHVHYEKK